MSKIEMEFAHICDMALFDKSNKLSIIGIFEEIRVSTTPTLHPTFAIVAGFMGEKGAYDLDVEIKNNGDDEVIAKLTGKINIEKKDGRGNFVGLLNMFPLEKLGLYSISFLIDGKKQSRSLSLAVNKIAG